MGKVKYFDVDTDFRMVREPIVMIVDNRGVIRYTSQPDHNSGSVGEPLWIHKGIPECFGKALLGESSTIVLPFRHQGSTVINWSLRFDPLLLGENAAVLLRVHPLPEFSDKLSEREIKVLRLIAVGNTHNDIAEELDISANTIGSTMQSIREKLNLHSKHELFAYASELDRQIELAHNFRNDLGE